MPGEQRSSHQRILILTDGRTRHAQNPKSNATSNTLVQNAPLEAGSASSSTTQKPLEIGSHNSKSLHARLPQRHRVNPTSPNRQLASTLSVLLVRPRLCPSAVMDLMAFPILFRHTS